MKTELRRMTALLLAFAMCLSLLSTNVWAAEVMAQEKGSVSAESEEKGTQEESFSDMKQDTSVDETAEKSENAQQTKELYEGQDLGESVDEAEEKSRDSERGEDSLEATEAEGPEITRDSDAGAEHDETIEAENHIPDFEEEREHEEPSDKDGSTELRAQDGDEVITENLEDLIQQLPDADDLDDDRYYYYKQLNDFEKVLYWKILDSIDNNYDTFQIDVGDYQVENKEISIVSEVVKCENPMTSIELSGYGCDLPQNNGGVFVFHPIKRYVSNYRREKLRARLNQIVSTVNSGDSYSKVMRLMQFIHNHIIYDYDSGYFIGGTGTDNANTLIGPLLYDSAVCEGFSLLIKTVCDEIDIPCVIVEGECPEEENIIHSWNLIKMDDNKWYLLDGTEICKFIYFDSEDRIAQNILKGQSYKDDNSGRYGGLNAIGIAAGDYDDISVPQLADEDYNYSGVYDYQSYQEAENQFEEPEAQFLYQVNEDGTTCTITGMEGLQEGDITIPESVDGFTVTTVGENAFYECTGFDGSIILPDSVITIRDGAFFKCSNLNGNLVLSKNLISIGERAFMGCENLEGSLQLSSTLTTIGQNAFNNCKKLTGDVYLSQHIQSVYNIFGNTVGITSFTVDENNTWFCSVDGVIYSKDLTRLFLCPCGKENIDIPETVTVIETAALDCCKKLTFDLKKLPPHLTEIKDFAFQNVDLQGDFVFPETLTYIGEYVFIPVDLQQVRTLTFPTGITHVGAGAFFNCNIKGEVYIPSTATEFDGSSLQWGNSITYVCNCSNHDLISWYDNQLKESYDWALRKIHGHTDCVRTHVEGFEHIWSVHYQCDVCGETIHDLESDYPIVYQGGCGSANVWKIDEEGNLLICGSGKMAGTSTIPDNAKATVKSIVIQDGFENIAPVHSASNNGMFSGCSQLQSVLIPESVKEIGYGAFIHCSENFIIKGYADSCAEEYAKSNYYEFIDVGAHPEHLSPGGHKWNDGTITKAATCHEKGEKTFACTVCEETRTEEIEIDSTNHSGGTELRNHKSATCTEAGYTGDTYCLGCGVQLSAGESISATGHDWGEWTTTKEPTEAEEGEKQRVCKHDASHIETGTIEKLSHVHQMTKTAAKTATCTEAGNIEYWTCTGCGKLFSDAEGQNELTQEQTVIAADGHNWNAGEVTTPATCTEKGKKTFTCTICEETRTEEIEIDSTNHSGGTELRNHKSATCTEAGYTGDTYCLSCGAKLSAGETIDATGHDWGEWTTTKEPTEAEEGEKQRVCKHDASHIETRAIDKLVHVHQLTKTAAKTATCTEAGNIEYWTCTGCGKLFSDAQGENELTQEQTVIPATGEHTWNAGEVTKAPSATESGVKTYTCTVCQATKTEAIPSLMQPLHGDFTSDNDITMADVTLGNQVVVGLVVLTIEQKEAADVTGDHEFTMADVVRMNRFVLGRIKTLLG